MSYFTETTDAETLAMIRAQAPSKILRSLKISKDFDDITNSWIYHVYTGKNRSYVCFTTALELAQAKRHIKYIRQNPEEFGIRAAA